MSIPSYYVSSSTFTTQRTDTDEFSHSAIRKSKYFALFQQYEDEIARLLRHIDGLSNENSVLKSSGAAHGAHNDMAQVFKMKCEQLQLSYDETNKDRDRLRESYRRLESENSILLQEINRLKAIVNENKSLSPNHYYLENYDKELRRVDTFVSESESAYRKPKSSPIPPSSVAFSPSSTQNPKGDELKFIKGDNVTFKSDLKVVKFVENNDKPYTSTRSLSYTQPLSQNDMAKFSPPKKTALSTTTTDRYKKNISFDLEVPSPLTQSLNNSTFNATASAGAFNSLSYNDLINDSSSSGILKPTTGNADSYSKRTRDDFHFEKPNYSQTDDLQQHHHQQQQQQQSDLQQQQRLNQSLTSEFNDCLQLLNEAESKIQSRSSPYVSKYQTVNNNSRPGSSSNSNITLPASSYPTASILKSSTILPDKYLRPHPPAPRPPSATTFDSTASYNSNSNTTAAALQKLPRNNNLGSFDYTTRQQAGYNSDSNLYNSTYRSRSSSVEPKN